MSKADWGDYCEHGVPRKFCTAKHEGDWPPKKYEEDPGIAAIGAAAILIFFVIYMIAMLFG